MKSYYSWIILYGLVVGCTKPDHQAMKKQQHPQNISLQETFKDAFLVGVALNETDVTNRDSKELINREFNTIVAENCMKIAPIHPQKNVYRFEKADKFIAYGMANDKVITGHVLVWHNQCPKWMFEDDNGEQVSREELIIRMREHIHTVVKRYKGKVKGWDVVNEAISDKGGMRPSKWQQIIGDEFIELAFQFAHEADPEAELYYNDYALFRPKKREDAVKIIQRLQAKNIRIDAIGMQGHYSLNFPKIEAFEASIKRFTSLGIKVMITELDVSVLPRASASAEITERENFNDKFNPYTEALPQNVEQQQAERYNEIFGVLLKHKDNISRVTFWGVNDGNSWKNNHPIKGRTDYPLLFDRQNRPKMAYDILTKIQ